MEDNIKLNDVKKRKRTSEIWNFFYPLEGESEYATCNFCNQKFSYKTTTSNLKKHLKSKHSVMQFSNVNKVEYDAREIKEDASCKEEDGITIQFLNKKPSPKLRHSKDIITKTELRESNGDLHDNGNSVKTAQIAYLEDEFDIFGKYMASQLRQLPIFNALRVQEQIQSLVTKERQACLSHEALTNGVNNFQEQYTQYTIECSTTPASNMVET